MNLSLLLLSALLLAGCSKFSTSKPVTDAAFFSEGESILTPSSDKISGDCFHDSEADACIFLKNPVMQEQSAVTFSEADTLRKFGVKIRGLSPTGYLENSRVQVYSLFSPRFTLHDLPVLKAPSPTGSSGLEQFSAYYWANRTFDYLQARVGAGRLPLRGLKIYADDAFTGFSAANNSIHLEKSGVVLAKAISGEVVIHLVGQAIAHSLSEQRLFGKNTTQHNYCALDPKACCAQAAGCAQALGNGFGEYIAAMMFPGSARVGESLAQATDGQKICALARDLNVLSGLTKDQVFSACQPAGRAVLMGAWYASVWWKLRAGLEAQQTGASQDVDKLFFDHARAWTPASTFNEAKAEALLLAGQYQSGKYLAAFTDAFAAAGL